MNTRLNLAHWGSWDTVYIAPAFQTEKVLKIGVMYNYSIVLFHFIMALVPA